MIRYTYTTIGALSLILGLIGLFLPLLPTTPFLILAAFCFSQSSPRFHTWLVNHRWFGPPIRDWEQNRAIRTRYKVLATVMMGGSLTFLLLKEGIPLAAKISFAVFAAAVLLYIWTRNSGQGA